MASRNGVTGCRKLLGLTSSGQRVVCGKTVARITSELCPTHEEFSADALVTFELSSDLADRISRRAEAYGTSVSQLLNTLIRAGIQLGLDSPQ